MIDDMLIRAALVLAGMSVFLVALTITVAPHIFFVVFRFLSAAVALTVAAALAVAALLCAGLAHIAG
jgi:hypothetical protein